ncbi:MAG TPA: enoyl-CoA hydratase/isomerase family protein [Burkholderiales bacterium]|nr:enoyl-CoA hydratase/isomerase family protein [Burkholderiales bacterium]
MAELLIEDRGAVRTLTMNRPEKRNALNNALTGALLEGLRAADADDAVHAIVLTGAGPGFCAGADLSEFKDLVADNQPLVERRAQLTTSLHEIFPRLTKPVVTAINGAAMGGGAGLALAGDIALMAESAKLGYPEVKHGIVAAIVMPNLVRQIGRKAAFELLATGQPVSARRALELGMVNRVVPDAELMSEALALAHELAAVSRPAMAATKQLFYQVTELPFAEGLATGREANKRMRAFRK